MKVKWAREASQESPDPLDPGGRRVTWAPAAPPDCPASLENTGRGETRGSPDSRALCLLPPPPMRSLSGQSRASTSRREKEAYQGSEATLETLA